jgi:hypothetical protein
MQSKKGTNPFVDPSEYKAYLDQSQGAFEAQLKKQQLSNSQ